MSSPTDVMTDLESNHMALIKHIINLCYDFDGRNHPMKVGTISENAEERNEAKASFQSMHKYWKNPNEFLTDDHFSAAMKNEKITSRTK